MFTVELTPTAEDNKKVIDEDKSDPGLSKQVKKALGYLSSNPKHPSLVSHKFESLINPKNPNEPVFESYAQNNTPSAYRIFWIYGSVKRPPTPGKIITVFAITSHP
jgi:hypothetical protein